MKIAMIGSRRRERPMRELAKHLDRRGHRVFLYLRSRKTGVWSATARVIFLPVSIVHYHGLDGLGAAFWLRLLRPGIRIVATVYPDESVYHQLALALPHRIIFTSSIDQVIFHQRFKKPAVFIPEPWKPPAAKKTNELTKFNLRRRNYFLTVARLEEQKGIHYLLVAFRGLRTDKKLVLVGAPGINQDYVEYLARLASDDPRIMFLGYQPRETLNQLQSQSFLYIDARPEEGIASPVFEAMACGIPVLVARTNENQLLIDRRGLFYEPARIQDLRRQLLWALNNQRPLTDLARRGQAFIRQQLAWPKILEKVESIYGLTSERSRGKMRRV